MNEDRNNDHNDIPDGPSGQQAAPRVFWSGPLYLNRDVGRTVTIKGRWSAPVTDFTQSDLILRAITITSFTLDSNNQDFTIECTIPSSADFSGLPRIFISRDAVTPNATSDQFLQIVTVTGPTVIWDNPVEPVGTSTTISGRWTQAITRSSFTIADINAHPGTVSNLVINANNQDFSVRYTPPGTVGTSFFTISTGVVTPTNQYQESNTFPITTPPPQSLTWDAPTGTQTSGFTVEGSWSRAITGNTFTQSDITVSTGTISGFSIAANNRDFSFTLTPPANAQGTINISVAANAVTPANASAATTSVVYDTRPIPRVIPTIGSPLTNRTLRTITWRVTVAPTSVTGFTADDIINRLPVGTTVAVNAVAGTPGSYDVVLGPFAADSTGTADFSIRANAFASLPARYLNNIQINATAIRFNFGTLVTDGHTFIVPVTLPPDSVGTMNLALLRNALGLPSDTSITGPLELQISPVIEYDTREVKEPTRVVSIVAENPRGTRVSQLPNGPTISYFRVEFNEELATSTFTASNITSSFEVISSGGSPTIGTPTRDTTDTDVWYIPVTFPSTGNGNAYFRVLENAGTLTSLTASSSDIYSWGITAIPTGNTTISYGTPIVDNPNRRITIPMTFGNIGSGLTPSDFSISSTNGTWSAIITAGLGGSNTRNLVLTNAETVPRIGSLTVTIASNAFTDRTVIGTSAQRTSESASYRLVGRTTTISYGSPNINNTERQISYETTFSNIGTGLEPSDFSVSASNGTWQVELSAGTGGTNTRTLTLSNSETVARSGSLQVTIDADAFDDRTITGDRTSGAAPYNLARHTAATVEIVKDRTLSIRHGEKVGILFIWDQDVTGFTTDDITISRGTKGKFTGSGQRYRLAVTAPDTGESLVVTVRRNAVTEGNIPTRLAFALGSGRPTTDVLESSSLRGTGLTYTPHNIYTIDQMDGENVGTLRTYSHAGVLTNTTTGTNGGLIESRDNQTRAIEILNNHFLIGANQHDRIGIARAPVHVPSVTFSEFFIDIGQWTASSSELTDTAILDIAIGNNRIYVLHSSGSSSEPRYQVGIFALDGSNISSFNIPVNEAGTLVYQAVPTTVVAANKFVYIGFSSLRSLADGSVISASTMIAYTLEGQRIETEDIQLGDLSGTQPRYGITSADWDDTNNTLWMLVDRGRVVRTDPLLPAVPFPYLASLELKQAVDASWATIPPQTLQAGNSLDTKEFAAGITSIYFGVGVDEPSWLSLSNGIITVASAGLPSTNTTENISLIGIGSGKPAYITFPLTLRRTAPQWATLPAFTREAGEEIDLNGFVTDATSITFRSGRAVPLGLTISNGIISIPDNAVDTPTPVTVHLSGNNPLGATHTSLMLMISNSAVDLLPVSFQQVPPSWQVLVGGQDISELVISVDNISHSLDLDNTGEFTIADCSIKINNSTRLYQRNGSFYTDNGINPFNAEIVVIGSYGDIRRRMFTGIILSINENINRQEVIFLCVDNSRILRDALVTDFGIEKYNVILDDGRQGYQGVYPLPDGLIPISDESLTATSEGVPLTVLQDEELKVFGDLNPSQVKQTNTALTVEGGILDTSPIVAVKSPPLYQRTSQYLNALLQSQGISHVDIDIPPITSTDHFSTVGRVGYNTEYTDIQRYAKDWVYDSTNETFYILAGSPSITENDFLWSWKPETDEWLLITAFEPDQEMWQLASTNYTTFYILGTEAREDIEILPNAQYDASETETGSVSRVKIWEVTSTSTTEYITNTNSYPPTLGHFYSVGFPRENANRDNYGRVPDTRGGFEISGNNLYYRYATGTDYGIAAVNLSTDRTSSFVSAGTPDNFVGGSGCAFYIRGNRMYVGYTNAPSDPAQLHIVRKPLSGGSTTTLVTLNDPTSGNRYAFTGCLELFVNGTTCYFVTQRQPRQSTTPYRRDETANASAVLYSVSTNGGTASVLKEYNYVQTAARSFVLHDNAPHFFEGTAIAYLYEPPDANWKGLVGRVQKIDGTDIEEVGLAFRSALSNPEDANDSYYGIHGGMVSPMHSVDDKLYLVAGYGNFDLVGQNNADINEGFNNSLIIYSEGIEQRLPRVITNQRSTYDILREIASSTNSVFGINHQRFFWASRNNLSAELNGNISSTSTSLSIKGTTGTFPARGYIRIDNEIIGYTNLSGTTISGITRGVAGTTASAHSGDASILYIKFVITDGAVSPVLGLSTEDDYTNLYNSIFVNFGDGISTYHTEDSTSIALYGRREHTVDTILNFTQQELAKTVGDAFLRTFKDLEQILTFSTDLALFLTIGDVVYLQTKTISATIRLYGLRHDFEGQNTFITARTIGGTR